MTKAELAYAAGVSYSTAKRYLDGGNVSPENLTRIVEAIELNKEEI